MTRLRLFDRMMQEVVVMPGFPALIVQRGWLYSYLVGCGWDMKERGFGSLDYTVFARECVETPLTPCEERDYCLGQVSDAYERGV